MRSSITVNGVSVTYGADNLVMTLITDENGEASTETDVLPYGTYLVLETKAPTGYLIENDANPSVTGIAEIVMIHTHSEIITAEKLFDDIIRGGVRFRKVDLERRKYEAQGDAALDGAEIRIYNISEHYVYAAEDQDSSGFHWVETGKEVSSGNGHVDILHGIEDPRSFDGAELVAVLTTDEEGCAGLGKEALPYGTYIAVETKPSRGYTLNTDWRVIFEIREDGLILDFSDSDNENLLLQQVIRGDVRVFKEDLELAELNGVDRNNYINGGYKGGEAAHQEGDVNPSQAIGGKDHSALRTAHLNNIEFTITNVSTLSVLSDAGTLEEFQPGEMVVVIKTYYNDEVGAYIAETTNKALPYGTYTIQETKTNNAYLLTDGTPRTFEIETDGEIVTTDKQTHHAVLLRSAMEPERMIFRNQIKRGEFEFVKIQGYTTERIQSLWVLENATSTEKHVLVTDMNGEYHSAEFDHSDNTNANDFLLDQIGDSYETMINLDAGLANGSIT